MDQLSIDEISLVFDSVDDDNVISTAIKLLNKEFHKRYKHHKTIKLCKLLPSWVYDIYPLQVTLVDSSVLLNGYTVERYNGNNLEVVKTYNNNINDSHKIYVYANGRLIVESFGDRIKYYTANAKELFRNLTGFNSKNNSKGLE